MSDVAAAAGVSKKTVSRILNDEVAVKASTRERVQKTMAALGYTPSPEARALALRRGRR